MLITKDKVDKICQDMVNHAITFQMGGLTADATMCMDAAEIMDTFLIKHDWEAEPEIDSEDYTE
jgi:hypothetical protein